MKLDRFRFKKLFPAIKNIVIFFGIFFLFSFLLIGSPGYLCPDTFYHTKLSLLIKTTGSLVHNFPWLTFTGMGDGRFIDHHLLFHVLGSFFVSPGDFLGMQVYIAILCTLFVFIFYLLMKKLHIKYPLFWIFVLLSSTTFLGRIILLRSIAASLIVTFLYVYFVLKKKYLLIYIMSFLFVWTYAGFVMALIIAIAMFTAERIMEKKWDIKLLMVSFGGSLSGFIINPYFPKNIAFYKIQNLTVPFINGLSPKFDVGMEWYPTDLASSIKANFPLWICFMLIIYAIIYYRSYLLKNTTKDAFMLVIMSAVTFVMSMRSQRFIEYWAPFTILASATMVRDHELAEPVINWVKKTLRKNFMFLLPLSTLILVLSFFPVYSIGNNYSWLQNANPLDSYRKASVWLKSNTQRDSVVYNVFWDDFPGLFYWNDYNRYISGMDTMFLCSYNKDLCSVYSSMPKSDDINEIKNIPEKFGTDIVLLSKWHNKEVLNKFKNNLNLEKEYEDEYILIFEIKNE